MSLHHAYLSGDIERFRALLNNEKDANIRLGGSSKQKPNKLDVNAVDYFGRTVLHLASTEGKLQYVEALLSSHSVDVAKPDRESGWTALHRALYAGQVTIARAIIARKNARGSSMRELLEVSDLESNTAFDVYNSTVSGVNPAQHDNIRGGSDFFSFGSNANHTLGVSDADDRAYPERILVKRPVVAGEKINKFREQRIRDVFMSKYHTLVLTTDASMNLYSCGFDKNGRLGVPGGTHFKLQPVQIPGQVITAAAAQDHSLAVTTSGDLYAWGSQTSGQLGYELESGASFSALPRKIIKLSKEQVIGVAASVKHSVCFTASSLFTWGQNDGQLGHQLNPQEGKLVLSPRKVTSLTASVKQVTATKFATVCLLETDDVLVFTNYGYFKVSLQLDRFASQYQVFRPRQSYAPSKIVKVESGTATIAMMTNMGDVFSFVLDDSTAGAKVATLAKSVRPGRVWSLRKKHMAIRDVAVGQEGTIIMCTESGSVFVGTKRNGKQRNDILKAEYKFARTSAITRIIQVRANEHGAFGLIRDDVSLLPIKLDTTDLAEDLLCILPYSHLILEEDETILDNSPDNCNDDQNSAEENSVPKHFSNACDLLRAADFADRWGIDTENHDCAFRLQGSRSSLPVHKAICCARSQSLKGLLLDGVCPDGFRLIVEDETVVIEITDSSVDLSALIIVVHWMYTDLVLCPWVGGSHQIQKRMQSVRQAAQQFALSLGLRPLSKTLSQTFVIPPKNTLADDISTLHTDVKLRTLCDMRLILSDGDLMTHSAILAARSEFFGAMVSGAWINARRDDSGDNVVDINVKHITVKVMTLVLNHVFHDRDTNVFDAVDAADIDDFLDLVISVMAAATEFILPRLKQACQAVLRRYVHRKNVAIILHEADVYAAEELKEACLDYCARNLQFLMENALLSDLSTELLHDLELYIARKQIERLPVSKSGELLSQLIQRHPSILETVEEDRDKYLKTLLLTSNDIARASADAAQSIQMQRKPSNLKTDTGKHDSPRSAPKIMNDDSLMFDMDDYDLTELDQRTSSLNLADGKFRESVPTSSSNIDVATKPTLATMPGTDGDQRMTQGETQLETPAKMVEAVRGWHTDVAQAPVVNLRSVLQTPTARSPSNSAMSPSPSNTARVSQRERKKQTTVLPLQNATNSASVPWGSKPTVSAVPLRSIAEAQRRTEKPKSTEETSTPPVRVPQTNRRPSSTPQQASVPRASSSLSKSYLAPSPTPSPGRSGLSLAEIIAAEETAKFKMAEYNAKRSMKEIQEQEEFEQWFRSESMRVQKEEQESAALAARLHAQERKPTKAAKKNNTQRSKGKTPSKDRPKIEKKEMPKPSSPKTGNLHATLKASASEFRPKDT